MANFRISVIPPGSGVPVRVDSLDTDIDFKSVRIGPDNLPITQDGSGASARLKTTKPIQIPVATNDDEASRWDQVKSFVTTTLTESEQQDSVKSILTEPTVGPYVAKDRYLVGTPATGDWATHDWEIAEWSGSAWVFIPCTFGTFVYVDDVGDLYVKGTTSWTLKKFDNITASSGAERVGNDIRIATDGVTETKIANSAVTENKIANNAVTEGKITANAVTEAKITANAVTEGKIAASAVTETKIGANAVTNTKILDEAVTGNKILAAIRNRLGVSGDTGMQAFSSTQIISALQTYAEALSTLDNYLFTALYANAQEEVHIVTNPLGITTLTCSSLNWVFSDDLLDITVFLNGKKLTQSTTAAPNKDYSKTSATTLSFSFTIPQNQEIVVRKERTGGVSGDTVFVVKYLDVPINSTTKVVNFSGTGVALSNAGPNEVDVVITAGSGGFDPGNVNQNIVPVTTGDYSLGSGTKGWDSVYLQDTATSDVYKLSITNGILGAELVI